MSCEKLETKGIAERIFAILQSSAHELFIKWIPCLSTCMSIQANILISGRARVLAPDHWPQVPDRQLDHSPPGGEGRGP